jgi:hypothetical protein
MTDAFQSHDPEGRRMAWPYCEGHPECHDSRTRQYARSFTAASNGIDYLIGENTWGSVIVTAGSRDPKWGARLCRSHALIQFGAA